MTTVNTNITAMQMRRHVAENERVAGIALERLSTGLRINRAADDPSGLIASESLRATSATLSASIENAQRAHHVINIAEGALASISDLLIDLAGLVVAGANEAGLSDEEKEANQLQVEGILDAIDHVVGTTTSQGRTLLNGTFETATFQIGPTIEDGRVSLALPGVTANLLGLDILRRDGEANLVDGNLETAQDIVDTAAEVVATLRGSLGAFQKDTLDSAIRNMQVALENTLSAESAIRDTDFAKEASQLVRSQILAEAGRQAIQIAHSQAAKVLDLLEPAVEFGKRR